MPEMTASEPAPAPKAPKPSKGSGFPGAPAQQQALSLPTIAALALAVIAIVLAIFGWFRPATGPGKFSDGQRQDAKANICQAQATVRQGTQINTNLSNPVPGDPAGDLAVGANARLALYAGGSFLHERLKENPATSGDLATAAGAMADTLEQLSINYLAGHSPDDATQQPLRDQLKEQISDLDGLCQE